MGVVIEIKNSLILKEPIPLLSIREMYPNFILPQNFYELSEEKFPLLHKKLKKGLPT
jgi:hypothetical protein